jgi:lysozyme
MNINDVGNVLSKTEYDKQEKKQTIHRFVNTILSVFVLIACVLLINPVIESTSRLYDRVSGIEAQRVLNSEIGNILSHEGFVECKYKDSLGYETIGAGHLILPTDNLPRCITPQRGIELLRKDYNIAVNNVDKEYPWAKGEVRLTLINLSFNIGRGRLAKFKNMLFFLEHEDYDNAAAELLDSRYAKQVPSRARHLAGRIMKLGG